MGIVYKTRHLRLNRPVALKMLLARAYGGAEERERFLREAEAVEGLRHANLVQVHDVGDHNDRPYFTMEYVEGGSLAQKLLGTPQPVRQAASLVATLAEAVQVAHQGGIVHRDLKPANILLTADGTPKIADFGLARHFDTGPALTMSGARVGTPSYMAPKQARGEAVDYRADLFSLGCVLYWLCTGQLPFKGTDVLSTLTAVATEHPEPPQAISADVAPALSDLIMELLHKDQGRRPASSQAVVDTMAAIDRGLRAAPGAPVTACGAADR
jgi:serine/threonine-protein kinase